jgi:hypothetical protein
VVKAKGKTIAKGSSKVAAGQTVVVTARPTRAGRRLLRRSRSLSARIEISIPGAIKIVRKLSFRR